MSHHATDWAFKAPKDLPTTDKFVLIALADHADADGICYPSWERIAKMTNLHRATVYRSLDRLITKYHLVSVLAGGGGRGRSNRYRLNVDVWRLPAEMAEHEHHEISDESVEPSLFVGVAERDPLRDSEVVHNGRAARRFIGDERVALCDERVALCDVNGRAARPESLMNHQEPRDTSVDNSGRPASFDLTDHEKSSGLSHVDVLRAQIAAKQFLNNAPQADAAG